MIQRTNLQSGFTLIELLLSLAFVSFILLFVISATLEVMGDYNKGIALKQINQSARSIIADMTTVVRLSTSGTANLSALGSGRACFNGVSYVWNIKNATTNQYTNGTAVSFARVQDAGGALCIASSGIYPNVNPAASTPLITGQIWVQSVGIVLSNDQGLATISLNLSTSGSNQPTVPSGGGLVCAGGQTANFCAVASFTTTVNARNVGG